MALSKPLYDETNSSLLIKSQSCIKDVQILTKGFIYKNKISDEGKMITLHHFLPIQGVFDSKSMRQLPILINSSWSEFLVLDCNGINLNGYPICNKIKVSLPKPNDKIYMNIDDSYKFYMKVCNIDFFPYDNINTNILTPYIVAEQDERGESPSKFVGLSGSPVFMGNKLIGVFSKICYNKIFLIIPIYVLLKNLDKKDNNNLYKFSDSEIPKKINSNCINNMNIYHRSLNAKIPYQTFLLLEGDLEKTYNITNSYNEKNNKEMIIDTKFSLTLGTNLIKSKQNINTYLITPRLLSLFKRILSNKDLCYIISLIKESKIKEFCKFDEELWLQYDKEDFKII